MRARARLGVLGLALLGASLLSACGSDSEPARGAGETRAEAASVLDPTETLSAFYARLADGDRDGALALMVPLSDAKLRQSLSKDIGNVVELCTRGDLVLSAHEHSARGRWACVVTRHAFTQNGKTEVLVRDEFLLRTSDGWRVASEPMRTDPAIAPLWDADADVLRSWFRNEHDGFAARYR